MKRKTKEIIGKSLVIVGLIVFLIYIIYCDIIAIQTRIKPEENLQKEIELINQGNQSQNFENSRLIFQTRPFGVPYLQGGEGTIMDIGEN